MLLTSFSGKNQTVFFQASDFFTKSVSYMSILAMTSRCMQWPLSFQTNRKSFAGIAQQLKRMLKNASSETLALWVRSRGDLYRNKSKRRSITMHSGQIWQSLSCQKVCCRFSVLRCCFLLFSRSVHCRRRVLELANNVTSHNNSWYATISLKTNDLRENARRKRRPQERPIERLSS